MVLFEKIETTLVRDALCHPLGFFFEMTMMMVVMMMMVSNFYVPTAVVILSFDRVPPPETVVVACTLLGGGSWRYLRRRKHGAPRHGGGRRDSRGHQHLSAAARPGVDFFFIFRSRSFPTSPSRHSCSDIHILRIYMYLHACSFGTASSAVVCERGCVCVCVSRNTAVAALLTDTTAVWS